MSRGRPAWAGLALTLSLACATPAIAAEISVESNSTPSSALIGIDGTLVSEDIDQFRTKVAGIRKAAVIFRSNGGSILAAIQIGRFIRSKNWITYVPHNVTCASACALAWLGGTRRFADPGARVGFHAAYIIKGGQVTETGLGNALVGAYLNEIGMRDEAIAYITSADPSSMRWLTADDAATFGIEFEALVPTGATPSSASVAASPTVPERSLEQRTASYITSIMASWSGSNADAAAAIQQVYASHVDYYGKRLTRQDVLADKRKFFERWPQRKYVIRTQSLATSCDRDFITVCTVTGTVDYLTSSAHTAQSKGRAQFEYRVLWTDQGPTIVHESSKVIDRTGWRKQSAAQRGLQR